ncbi:MAG TPA: NnrU family protein [Paracoccaceae bacterium]|mgnify:CR=1 FL=1|nr:NnrU family protein [Paracoccaceae bacterium]HMO71850.1 NnrU family protein [Paracoccaceae bacterium]
MTGVLILGVALWTAAHLWKRLAPGHRAGFGDKGKGLATFGILAGVVLMVVGYRGAEFVPLWSPPAFLTHVNNLLMLLAVYLFAASGMKTLVTRTIRHPQLTGFKTWAAAHLLVNGDLASIVLFGGLLAWAVVSVILINRAQPVWTRPERSTPGREIGAIVGALVATGVIGWIHSLLGYWPYG